MGEAMIVNRTTYRHYKGTKYFVHFIGRHTETQELLAIYSDELGNTWVRPYSMFIQKVIVNNKLVNRFEKCIH